jgi:hypothetical protein
MAVVDVCLLVLCALCLGAAFGAAWEYQRGTARLRKRYQNLVQVAAESGWTDMVLAASADVGWVDFAKKHGL